jgi:hypothetical protein
MLDIFWVVYIFLLKFPKQFVKIAPWHWVKAITRQGIKGRERLLQKILSIKTSEIIKQYQNCTDQSQKGEKIIWLIWFQGVDEMPDFIRECYDSVLRHAGNYQVILLTDENIGDYLVVPEVVKAKIGTVWNRDFLMAHYSDVVRFGILAKYGGMWLDATMYVTQDLPVYSDETELVFNKGTLRFEDDFWVSYVFKFQFTYLWMRKNTIFANYMYAALCDQIANDRYYDYFMTYAIALNGIEQIPHVSKAYAAVPTTNPQTEYFSGTKFDSTKLQHLDELQDTFAFKLSRKEPAQIENATEMFAALRNIK